MPIAVGIVVAAVAGAIAAFALSEQASDGADASGISVSDPSTIAPRVATSTTAEPPPRPPTRVAFFGDSIATEANPSLGALLTDRGIAYHFDGFGGTAMCDYLDEMRANVSEFHPDAVVLLFTGNGLTPCMTDRTGGGLGLLEKSASVDLGAYLDAYEQDTIEALQIFGPSTPVYLVGPLQNRWGRKPSAQRLSEVYAKIADGHPNVQYVTEVESLTPGGAFAAELPCGSDEPCAAGELIPVRAEDGGHLCPKSGFCFGGLRLASTITQAIGAAS